MKALLDRQHIAPGRAHARLAQNLANGWASCPLTESGCLRVLTNPRHVAPVPATDVLTKLATAKTGGHYEFWADDLTITDAQVFDRGKWRGHQQVTDAYNDGNLESDSLWTYTWDAENRLIQMQSQSNVSTNDRRKLTFEYDWQSRRIRKKVYEWDDEDYATTASTDIKFLYDGWNLIAELDDDNDLLRSYVWGLDLSGSPQGAGGVGGLVLFKNNTQTPTYHFPAYDGNGNVVALVAASDGVSTAQYEYSPFGETLSATGGQAAYNPFRFSSKYTDNETGLLYYGYRYYNPTTGRWPSRDPIGEFNQESVPWDAESNPNLFSFVKNNPLSYLDILGLRVCKVYIWIGHNGIIKTQLQKGKYHDKYKQCYGHVVFSCRVASSFPEKVQSIISIAQPYILIGMGGSIRSPGWEIDPELDEYIPYYKEGMTWKEYNNVVFEEVIIAAKAHALAMSMNKALMKYCCCDKVQIEVKKVKGWKLGQGNIPAMIKDLESSPWVYNAR